MFLDFMQRTWQGCSGVNGSPHLGFPQCCGVRVGWLSCWVFVLLLVVMLCRLCVAIAFGFGKFDDDGYGDMGWSYFGCVLAGRLLVGVVVILEGVERISLCQIGIPGWTLVVATSKLCWRGLGKFCMCAIIWTIWTVKAAIICWSWSIVWFRLFVFVVWSWMRFFSSCFRGFEFALHELG